MAKPVRLMLRCLPALAGAVLAIAATPALAWEGHHHHSARGYFSFSFGGYGYPYAYAYPYPAYGYYYGPYAYGNPVYGGYGPDYGGQANYDDQPQPQPDPRYCREFRNTIVIDGRQQPAHGTACLEPDGSWKIIGQ